MTCDLTFDCNSPSEVFLARLSLELFLAMDLADDCPPLPPGLEPRGWDSDLLSSGSLADSSTGDGAASANMTQV